MWSSRHCREDEERKIEMSLWNKRSKQEDKVEDIAYLSRLEIIHMLKLKPEQLRKIHHQL